MDKGTIETCKTCHKRYRFVGGPGGPIQDREEYFCPYCGAREGSEKTSGLPRTYKLESEE